MCLFQVYQMNGILKLLLLLSLILHRNKEPIESLVSHSSLAKMPYLCVISKCFTMCGSKEHSYP